MGRKKRNFPLQKYTAALASKKLPSGIQVETDFVSLSPTVKVSLLSQQNSIIELLSNHVYSLKTYILNFLTFLKGKSDLLIQWRSAPQREIYKPPGLFLA